MRMRMDLVLAQDHMAWETQGPIADRTTERLATTDRGVVMLRQVMTALMTNDRTLAREVSRMDNTVDKLDEAIKLFVTKLTRGSLDEREGRRAMEIISFAINLEHIGDIIDKNLSELAARKIKRKLQFSPRSAACASSRASGNHFVFIPSGLESIGITSTRQPSTTQRQIGAPSDVS